MQWSYYNNNISRLLLSVEKMIPNVTRCHAVASMVIGTYEYYIYCTISTIVRQAVGQDFYTTVKMQPISLIRQAGVATAVDDAGCHRQTLRSVTSKIVCCGCILLVK